MSAYSPQQPGGYPQPAQPGYLGGPPPHPGGAVPPYQPYQMPLPGQPGYQWGAGVPAYPFASFGARVGAALIDGLIILAIAALPVIIGIGMIVSSVDTNATYENGDMTNVGLLAAGILVIIIGEILGMLYEPLTTGRQGTHNGQSLGRQAVGIRITNLQGGPITTGQAWGRYAFKRFVIGGIGAAFTGGLTSLINDLWMLWDSNKQCWHDKIANTLVLRA